VALLPGCADWTVADTPLEVTAVGIGFEPGEPVVGEVVHPEGGISVTIAPAPVDLRRPLRTPYGEQDETAAGARACDFSAKSSRYSCPTTGLAQGRYVVQVTDAGMPSEGTASVEVAVHPFPAYEPAAGQVPFEEPADEGDDPVTFEREAIMFADAGGSTLVPLTGWAPGTTVRVSVRADGGRELHRTTADIGSDGTGQVLIPPLRPAEFNSVVLTDGVWVAQLPLVVD
jgi:hypothetical protein